MGKCTNVVLATPSILSLIFLIVAFAVQNWQICESDSSCVRYGLTEACPCNVKRNTCMSISLMQQNNPLTAPQSLEVSIKTLSMCLGLHLVCLVLLLVAALSRRDDDRVKILVTIIIFAEAVAGVCGIISMSVYSDRKETYVSSSEELCKFGLSYFVGWCGVIGALLSSLFVPLMFKNIIATSPMDLGERHPFRT